MYKKKDGTITVTDDQKLVTWTPAAAPGGPPVVSLAIANITSMLLLPLPLPTLHDGRRPPTRLLLFY